mgnify:CR=1 FL=1
MIDPKFIVRLKGKDYPTWPGILDAATKAGLRSLTTRVLQVPVSDNGNLAVVMARAEFEDGRVYEDVGDCSPASTSPQLASAALRLASTRAKGRVLRDAINVGMTMYEELPDNGGDPQPEPMDGRQPPAPEPEPEEQPILCMAEKCGVILSNDELRGSLKRADRFDGKVYCSHHGAEILKAGSAVPEAAK